MSNDVSEWSAYLREKYGIDDLMEISVISGDVMCRKPDRRIYQIALECTKEDASDCVFVDDRDKNLIPALELGMKVIRFLRDEERTELDDVVTISNFSELEDALKKNWN